MMQFPRGPRAAAALSIALALAHALPSHAAGDLVISEVRVGDGDDLVEVLNRGGQPAALSGKSLQYAGPDGHFGQSAALPDAVLPPGGFFLLHLAADEGGPAAGLPVDAIARLDLHEPVGRLALVEGIAALGCGADATPCAVAARERVLHQRVLGDHGQVGDAVLPPAAPRAAGSRRIAGATIQARAPAARGIAPPVRLGPGTGHAPGVGTGTPKAVRGLVGIHAVQGSGRVSPLLGDDVTVEGVVTAVTAKGFFLQSAPGEEDAGLDTSEGVFVFTNGAAPAAASRGNRVSVTGRVSEYTPASRPHQLSVTQITSPAVTFVSGGHALPAPVEITWPGLSASSPVDSLERLEGMRVSAPTLAIVGPDPGRITESTATAEATGEFHVVLPFENVPLREPGIGVLDVTPLPAGVDPPDFDTNPERLRFVSTGQAGAPVVTADGRGRVYGFVGVLDYGDAAYSLLPDPDAALVAEDGIYLDDLPWAWDEEVTIGTFNLQRFYDDVDDAGGDTVLATEAFQRRLARTARAICVMMDSPDILAVMEVENLRTLSLLAEAINDDVIGGCRENPEYAAHLVEGNDPGKINIGYLVSTREVAPGSPRVRALEVTQMGKGQLFANPDGSSSLLNDRPPLLLRARIYRDATNSFPVTLVANHLRSLNGVNSLATGSNGWSSEGHRVRAKRAAQARYLAGQVQVRQAADPNEKILLLGDFNAFEFSDGYVDVMGIVTGREAAASQVLTYMDSPIVTPLTNLVHTLPPDQRYSYIHEGNRQALDHIVANQALLDSSPDTRLEFARFNAEAGGYRFGIPDRISRVSDHDPAVAYIPVSTFGMANVWAGIEGIDDSTAGKPVEWRVAVFNDGPVDAGDVTVDIALDEEFPGLVLTPPPGFTCAAPVAAGGRTTARCQAAQLAASSSGGPRIGLRTDTLESQAGTEVMVEAEVRAGNPDDYPDDNFTFSSTRLTPPYADLQLRQVNAAPGGVAGPTGRLEFALKNNGRDEAVAPQFVLTLAAGKTKVTPVVPAGWTCAPAVNDGSTTRVTCTHAAKFLAQAEAVLAFDLLPGSTTQVSANASVASVTDDPWTLNNQIDASLRILVRTTR
jgi:predicted extracellular nuclease